MTSSVAIADAGALIALARIGQLDLLRGVFGAVSLTAVVAAKIVIDARGAASKAGRDAIRQSLAAGWLTIADLGAEVSYPPLNPGVEAGESSTIALALQRRACGEWPLVIMADRSEAGRKPGAMDSPSSALLPYWCWPRNET
jgi:predicted nucleic acid-binding protein